MEESRIPNEKTIENLFKIAVNIKPKPHLNNGKTRKQNLDLVNLGVVELQRLSISYRCIIAAVMKSKDNKNILKEAEALMDEEIKRISGND